MSISQATVVLMPALAAAGILHLLGAGEGIVAEAAGPVRVVHEKGRSRALATLSVINRTSQDLTFHGFELSCDCMKSGEPPETLPAGGTADIDFAWDVTGERQTGSRIVGMSLGGEELHRFRVVFPSVGL